MFFQRNILRPKMTYHNATDISYYPNDLKTERQWKKIGYQLKENAEEFKLWTNPHHHQLSSYYLREDVEPIRTELPWK